MNVRRLSKVENDRVLPKYVYETKYHPAKDPGQDNGFPDHHHNNLWSEEAGNRYELFRFKYNYNNVDMLDSGGKDIF